MRIHLPPKKEDPKRPEDDVVDMVEGGSYDKPDDLDLARVGDDRISAERDIL